MSSSNTVKKNNGSSLSAYLILYSLIDWLVIGWHWLVNFSIWQMNVCVIIVHFMLIENMLFCSSWGYPIRHTTCECDSHHFECNLVSRLPQVLLLYCVPLHPRWLHQCHPTCQQWHLPHSDLPPTRHHLQDWGGGCEEGRQSRRAEGKGHGKISDCNCKWVPTIGCI